MGTISTRHIVVAVDGSDESTHALRWAIHHTADGGHPIRIVTAYPHPTSATEVPMNTVDLYEAAESSARHRAWLSIELVADELGERPIEHVVAAGSLEQVLDQYARSAELVVVGTRPRSKWYHRLRSSATNRVTGSVNCPVISIPPTTTMMMAY